MIDYKAVFKDRERRLRLIYFFTRFIPDKPYIKMVFRIKTGKKLNLKNPTTFCDKQNWLKLHDKKEEYTDYVDKVKLHEVVKKKLGEDICFEMLGHWEHYDDIDFDALPEKFVLKCNHDSASVKIVTDKAAINHAEFKKFFENRLKMNAFYFGREYPYKNVKPCILAEKYMKPDGQEDLEDYKFFCFNGEPKLMFVVKDRATDCTIDHFDREFNRLKIYNTDPYSDKPIAKPEKFDEMWELAAKLSEGIKFVRIDLYEVEGKLYLGEYTFFEGGGFWPYHPDEWERRLGDWINIDA
ncbi:MAG: glycosyl transferase [Clostridia bacterium]|nr:glycosyl transferase [Clostridia bacterium]